MLGYFNCYFQFPDVVEDGAQDEFLDAVRNLNIFRHQCILNNAASNCVITNILEVIFFVLIRSWSYIILHFRFTCFTCNAFHLSDMNILKCVNLNHLVIWIKYTSYSVISPMIPDLIMMLPLILSGNTSRKSHFLNILLDWIGI